MDYCESGGWGGSELVSTMDEKIRRFAIVRHLCYITFIFQLVHWLYENGKEGVIGGGLFPPLASKYYFLI